MEPPVFKTSRPLTIGVELELELLDKESLNLSPKAPELLKRLPTHLTSSIKAEFIQSMVEISTPVCADMAAVEKELRQLYHVVTEMAAALDCVPYAASLHPFASVIDRHPSPGTRYGEILNELQIAGRRMMTQALHVHIGLPDAETAIRVCDAIRPYLPVLLALTTSSPYFEGSDTGFYSYRTSLFKNLPRSNIPETLGSWEKFQDILLLLNEGSILTGIKELWWDVRPQPDFGTVEIRICDLPSRLNEILAVTALVQALVATLSQQDDAPVPNIPHREIMLHNKWHACRYGLEGTCISMEHGRHKSFGDTIPDLLDLVDDQARILEVHQYLQSIETIRQQGTSAHRQRKLFDQTGSFRKMINTLRQEFLQ